MTVALFNHLWQSTVFAVAVGVLSLACRHNRARVRYALWFAASVKFLVPFAALAAVGGVVTWQQPPAAIRSVVASPVVRDLNAPFAEGWLDVGTTGAAPTLPSEWLAPLLCGIWACGFTAIALWRVRQWREIRVVLRTSTTFDGAVPPVGIEIRTAPTTLEPGVVGIRRPVILLPRGLEACLTTDQLAAIIAHEVCHVRRRDNLTAAVHMLVEAACWFHPVVWWIGSRLVETREQACDEHVMIETGEPTAYAEGMVTVCRRYLQSPLMRAGVGGADVSARIEAILSNRIGARLTSGRRLMLVATAAIALAAPLVSGAIEAAGQLPGVPAGGPPIDPEIRFDVVSIKPVADTTGPFGRFLPSPQRFEYSQLPIGWFLRTAVQKPDYQIIGAPGWIETDRFTILAKPPEGAPLGALNTLMLNLLKDRFHLAMHTETRELPIYNLVLARTDGRLGPDIKTTSAACQAKVAEAAAAAAAAAQRGLPPPLPGQPGGPPLPDFSAPTLPCDAARYLDGNVAVSGRGLAQFTRTVADWVGRPVFDKTGLTGLYDFTLTFARESRSAGPLGPTLALLAAQSPQAPADPNLPSLSVALQEQLGLKLEPSRGPVEIVVIDRLEKPSYD